MVEPITTVGLGAIAAYLGKDGIAKILGPTTEYIGEGLKDLTKRRIDNVGKIFRSAEEKLGDDINEPGTIPPKVLNVVINDGSFNDDDLALEYMGGVLASSRTKTGRDDRGARISRTINNMSCYQLRAHYLIYSTISQLFKGSDYDFRREHRGRMEIFVPFSSFSKAMDFSEEEFLQSEMLTSHIIFGLFSDSLIEKDFLFGDSNFIHPRYPQATESGAICIPSVLGAELFMWAFGAGKKNLNHMFKNNFSAKMEDVPDFIENSVAMRK